MLLRASVVTWPRPSVVVARTLPWTVAAASNVSRGAAFWESFHGSEGLFRPESRGYAVGEGVAPLRRCHAQVH
jgi:hypothetical protein